MESQSTDSQTNNSPGNQKKFRFDEAFKKAPSHVQKFINSDENNEISNKIAEKYGLSLSEKLGMSWAATHTMLKNIPLLDFPRALKEKTGIEDNEKVKKIALDIATKKFAPIRDYLEGTKDLIRKLGGDVSSLPPIKPEVESVEKSKPTGGQDTSQTPSTPQRSQGGFKVDFEKEVEVDRVIKEQDLDLAMADRRKLRSAAINALKRKGRIEKSDIDVVVKEMEVGIDSQEIEGLLAGFSNIQVGEGGQALAPKIEEKEQEEVVRKREEERKPESQEKKPQPSQSIPPTPIPKKEPFHIKPQSKNLNTLKEENNMPIKPSQPKDLDSDISSKAGEPFFQKPAPPSKINEDLSSNVSPQHQAQAPKKKIPFQKPQKQKPSFFPPQKSALPKDDEGELVGKDETKVDDLELDIERAGKEVEGAKNRLRDYLRRQREREVRFKEKERKYAEKIGKLELQLFNSDTGTERARTEAENLKKKLGDSRDEIGKKDKKISNLQVQLITFQEETEQAREEIEKLKNKLRELIDQGKKEDADFEERKKRREKRISDLELQLFNTQEEVDRIRTDSEKVRRALRASLEEKRRIKEEYDAQKGSYKKRISDLEDRLVNVQTKVDEAEKIKGKLKGFQEQKVGEKESKPWKFDREQIKERIAILETRLNATKVENERLKVALKEAREKLQRPEKLKEDFGKEKDRMSEVEKEPIKIVDEEKEAKLLGLPSKTYAPKPDFTESKPEVPQKIKPKLAFPEKSQLEKKPISKEDKKSFPYQPSKAEPKTPIPSKPRKLSGEPEIDPYLKKNLDVIYLEENILKKDALVLTSQTVDLISKLIQKLIKVRKGSGASRIRQDVLKYVKWREEYLKKNNRKDLADKISEVYEKALAKLYS